MADVKAEQTPSVSPVTPLSAREGASAALSPLGSAALQRKLQRRLQRRAGGSVPDDPAALHAVAAQGIAGSSAPLPHQASIQSAFGPHDVSGIQAQIGGAAGPACEALGATAYATGDRVAFREQPDLHTAAHEAAHVVQQRGGVQLQGGVGQAGDPYERHADAVADLVVQGRSAAHLLGAESSHAPSGAVQRQENPTRDRKDEALLGQQAKLKDVDTEIAALEGSLLAGRKLALERRLMTQATFDASLQLSQAMTRLQPVVKAGAAVDPALQAAAAAAARQLYAALASETADEKHFQVQPNLTGANAVNSSNPYTGQSRMTTSLLVYTKTFHYDGWLKGLPDLIQAGTWDEAFRGYRQILQGTDQWAADQLKQAGKSQGPDSAEEQQGQRQGYQRNLRNALEGIADHHPTRLPAVFHPDPATIESERKAGRQAAESVPMNVYSFKDAAGKWHLHDLTAPGNPHEQPLDHEPTPAALATFFEEVCRFPKGEVRYQIPGGGSGVTATTGKIKWYEWVGYVGLGAAVIGLGLLSGGFTVYATVAFAAGSVASGVAAAGHLTEQARLGTLSTASAVLDGAQIVGAIFSFGGAVSAGVRVTAKAAGPLAAASIANRICVPLAAGADVVQLVAFTDVSYEELKKVEAGAGSAEDKQRAMAILVTQWLVMGGLTVLSVQSARSARSLAGKQLELANENGLPVLRGAGETATPTLAPTTKELADGYEKGVAQAGSYRKLPPEVIDELTSRLPGIKVDPADPIPAIAEWLTREIGKPVQVSPLGKPGSGALVYSVTAEGKLLGVFKVFPDKGEMLRELASLERIRAAGLKKMEVGTPSDPAVVEGLPKPRGAAVLEPAQGHFVQNRLDDAGKLAAGTPERAQAISALEQDVRKVAAAMAEMHDTLASGGTVSKDVKATEITVFNGRWEKLAAPLKRAGVETTKLQRALELLVQRFRSAKLDATVVHGDAHTGNFSVQDNGKVGVIDTETLFRSVNSQGQGQSAGAADVGRYYESLFTHGRLANLAPGEIEQIQAAFLDSYRKSAKAGGGADLEAAMRFYQANWELIILQQTLEGGAKPSPAVAKEAAERLAAVLGVK